MSDIREALFESLFQIAEDYDINLTNSPDMRPGVPEIGDFCGDVEKAVLAAGYVKPRTITTAAELDALPPGTIIREGILTFSKWGSGAWGTFSGSTYSSDRVDLPVTVLYEP